MKFTKIFMIQILLLLFALSGCSDQGSNEKLISENVRTIKAGMEQQAVAELLGGAEPYKIVKDPKVEARTTHYYRGKRMSATVKYLGEKVISVNLNGVQVAS